MEEEEEAEEEEGRGERNTSFRDAGVSVFRSKGREMRFAFAFASLCVETSSTGSRMNDNGPNESHQTHT